MMQVLARVSTILLIDHDPVNLTRMVQTLTAAGHHCLISSDAQSALNQVRQIPPDLMISEYNLCGQSGVEVCNRLRLELQLEKVPLMFLSAQQSPDVLRRREGGGAYFLRKPCDATVLVELVASTLAAARTEVERRAAAAMQPAPAQGRSSTGTTTPRTTSSAAAFRLPVSELPLEKSTIPALAQYG